MPQVFNTHAQASPGAQLRGFGYTTYANVAALPGTGQPGEIVFVTAEGRLYQWDTVELRFVRWGDTGASAWKAPVEAAATTNVNLLAPGATVDGVALAVGDRFLAGGQTAPIENGIYVYNGAAVPATRALDANGVGDLDGASVLVMQGTNGDRQYQQTADNVTPGTTAQTWTLIGPATGVAPASDTVAGIVELATNAEAIAGTDTARAITPANLDAVLTDKGGTALFGGATTGTIAHGVTGLAATDRLIIETTVEATGFPVVIDVTNDATNLTWTTVAAPAANEYRATWWSVA